MKTIQKTLLAMLIGGLLASQSLGQPLTTSFDFPQNPKPNERPKEKDKEPPKNDNKDKKDEGKKKP